MKKYLVGLFVCVFMIGAASAEVMMTANPLGTGKWNMTVGSKLDQNYFDMGAVDVLYLDSVGYGINDRLDIYATTGIGYSQKATDKPRTMDAMTMINLGASLKFALLTEDTKPLALAVTAGIKGGAQSKSSMNNWQYNVGLIASKKVKKLLNPYAGVNYRSIRQNYGDYSQMDYTAGVKMGTDGRAVMLEDTLQSVTFAGSTFQSNQFALSFSFDLN
jgi:hypothetical protein